MWRRWRGALSAEDRQVVEKIRAHRWKAPADRDELLGKLADIRGLTPDEAALFLIDSDPAVRSAGLAFVRTLRKEEANAAVLSALTRQSEEGRKKTFEIYVLLSGGQLTIEQLRELCTDRRPSVVSVALEWIRSHPEPRFLPLLEAPLASPSTAMRKRAVKVLEKLGSAQAIPFALPLAHDNDEEIRFVAMGLLARHPTEQCIASLMKGLADPSARVQEIASKGLQPVLNSDNLVAQVIPLLSESNPQVRSVAAKLLREQDPDVVAQAFITTFSNMFGAARERGLSVSRQLGPRFMMALAARARDSNPVAAGLAASIAVTIRSPEIVPLLVLLLTQPDWWLRHRAAEALAEIKDERGLAALIALLEDPDSDLSAAAALGTWGNPAALPGLVEAYKRGTMDLRLEILDAFSKIRDSRVPTLLQNITKVDPESIVREKAIRVLQELQGGVITAGIEATLGRKFEPFDFTKHPPELTDFLSHARALEASDLHLGVGAIPHIRVHGSMTPLPVSVLTSARAEQLIYPLLSEPQRGALAEQRHVDFCYKAGALGRFRTNIFFQRNGLNAVLRLIPTEVPTLEDIGLPESVWELADYSQGLILVTGSAGSGKTTTQAALIERINRTQTCHIITIEDPIEYIHRSKECLITQREVPTHSETFSKALRQALREDPDVVMVGELRDLDTISLAMTAAETGHLVLGTLHTSTAGATVDRVIDAFPPGQQNQIRQMLAESLKGVIAQTLLPRRDGKGRVAAFEILRGTPNVSGLIRDGKTFQLPSAIQTGSASGMQMMDGAMLRLVEEGIADPGAAYDHAIRKDLFEPYIEPEEAAV